ncbi:MAG: hypothetical protein M1142_03790 [Patescibacteria group bacterium]|nr:hypothetical protein [Patescibacteria group bacterium]
MSLEGNPFIFSLFSTQGILLLGKFGVLTLIIFYFIFSLIIVRQVKLMTETLMTEVTPLLRAFAILHAGFALGIIILFIGYLF